MIKHLNFEWTFVNEDMQDAISQKINGEIVSIPHTNVLLPYNYVDENLYQFKSTYQKLIPYDLSWINQHITLTFEGVAHEATVYFNGHLLGVHQGGYTPFSYDVTSLIKSNDDQVLTVFVDARETLNFPPFGHVIDYLTYGGIYREVYLEIRDQMHIEDVFIYGKNLLTDPVIHADITLSRSQKLKLELDINFVNQKVISYQFDIQHQENKIDFQIPDLKLWSIDSPHLYSIHFKLIDQQKILDEKIITTGFRDAEFRQDGFYLNGNRIKLIGLNRHQDYPYVGYAMPKSAQFHDAYILKKELNCHIVRTSHYPQSKHFIEACDFLGLLVFEEIPGWQHIGNDAWKNVAKSHVSEMVKRDRNNPSVILWGVRINESGDDDLFYTETNKIAKSMDPSRQTAGVRFITHSSILEDVFTLNDFIHEGHNIPLRALKDVTHHVDVPYLVTEHTGHMFPTKSFDHEHKRLEHAKRHLRIINHMLGDNEISGVIGWCMHDYNTHIDFGSGDKICYHGVLDMFRNTKLAAHAYQSNQNHTPYLEVSTNFNIGDYPKGFIDEVLVFSNCDQVFVYRNDLCIGELKRDLTYSNMPYAPYQMDWFGDLLIQKEGLSIEKSNLVKQIYKDVVAYGENHLPLATQKRITSKDDIKLAYSMYGKYVANWGVKRVSYSFKGYINQKLVIESTKGNDFKELIQVKSDVNELVIDETYDVTRITVEALNEHGHRLIYSNEAFTIETDELLDLIGPRVVSLMGGVRSFWVKTKNKTGTSKITIKHHRHEYDVMIHVLKEE